MTGALVFRLFYFFFMRLLYLCESFCLMPEWATLEKNPLSILLFLHGGAWWASISNSIQYQSLISIGV